MVDFTDDEWEEIARRWRQAASMADAVLMDAPAFVRWLKRQGYIKDYVCVPDEQLPTSEGKYDPDKGIIFYRLSIWNAGEKGDPHARWTLIHEASHVILRHKEVRFRANASINNRLSRRTGQDEIAVNRLTASILAPFEKAEYKPDMTVEEIQEKFGLSRQAATKRLAEYARMFRQKSGIRRELPPTVTDFLLHQKRKGHRVTSIGDIEAFSPRSDERCEGDLCPCCNEFALVREGLSRKCRNCGARAGDD
jgi:Zn-dependent peptidase ImmA (M78 family)